LLEYKNFITIGKITKPIGIKGNLKIISLTDFPERFEKLKAVILYSEKDGQFFFNIKKDSFDFDVTAAKVYDKYVNIKLDGFDSIESTQPLINMMLMIDEKNRMKLEEGSYYYYEMVGCDVYSKEELIGKVISIVNYGSGDLFNVEYRGKEVLIPFRDEFIKKIDLKNRRIDTELIEGFLD